MLDVEVDGRRIAYARAGEGPVILLLHGFGGDHREWGPQLEALSLGFDVLAWDAPGAGGSELPPDDWRLGEFADAVAGFLRALHLDRAHVAGLSFGGALALELYRRHPDVVDRLILVSAYAGWRGSLGEPAASERLRASLAFADGTPEAWLDAMLPTLFPDGTSAAVIGEFTAIAHDIHLAGFRTMARALAEADLRDVLPNVECPTLLVYGEADVRAGTPVAEAMHAAIPGSRLVLLPGIGHLPTLQAVDALNRELVSFLDPTPSA